MRLRLSAALAVAVVAGSALAAEAGGSRVLQCASGSTIARLSAIYVETTTGNRTVKSFDVDLEINGNAGYREGQRVVFYLDGRKIGQQRLTADARGDLDADLKFASGRGGFPNVKPKSTVAAEVRGVTLGSCVL